MASASAEEASDVITNTLQLRDFAQDSARLVAGRETAASKCQELRCAGSAKASAFTTVED